MDNVVLEQEQPQVEPTVMYDQGFVKALSDGTVIYDGLIVPHISVHIRNGAEGPDSGKFQVSVDSRFGGWFDTTEAFHQFIWLSTQMMAVACGYTSFGKNCRPDGKFNQ